jgi:hypothetical protein
MGPHYWLMALFAIVGSQSFKLYSEMSHMRSGMDSAFSSADFLGDIYSLYCLRN